MELTARNFLTTIYSDLSGYIGIFSTDEHGAWNGQDWFHLPEQMDAAIAAAEWGWSRSIGYSPFVYSRPKRQTDPDAITRLIAVDADYHGADEFDLPPSFVVETSPGSFHLGWLLDAPTDQATAVALGRAVRDKHGLEASATSTSKILRIPDSYNADSSKVAGSSDFHVSGYSTSAIYTLDQIQSAYPVSDRSTVRNVTESATIGVPEVLPTKFQVESKFVSTPRIDALMAWRSEEQFGAERERRSERIHELCHLLFEAGLEPEDVLVFAWDADPVQEHYVLKGGRPQSDFWKYDVLPAWNRHQAQPESHTDDIQHISTPPVLDSAEITKSTPKRDIIKLLTATERENAPRNFVDDWVDMHRLALDERTPTAYMIATGYTVLGLAFADLVHTIQPGEGAPIRPNVYFLALGPTGTNKTGVLKVFQATVDVLSGLIGYTLTIGNDITPEGLIRSLRDWDGRSAVVTIDEIGYEIQKWVVQRHYSAGSPGAFLNLYNNVVPQQRRGTKDNDMDHSVRLGGFFALFTGTPERVYEVLPREFYFSGFMQRLIPLIGNRRDVSRSELRKLLSIDPGEKSAVYRRIPEEFGYRLAATRGRLGGGDRLIPLSDECRDRWITLMTDLLDSTRGQEMEGEVAAIMGRLATGTLKLATAVAIDEGSETVELGHLLSVLKHAEDWVANVYTVLDNISASEHSRRCDAVMAWINDRGGKVSPSALAKNWSQWRPMEQAEVLTSLREQGRLRITEPDDKRRIWYTSTEV